MKNNYYREIMKYLEEKPMEEPYGNTATGFFEACQLYYGYYLINDKIRNAKKTLKNYMNEENYIARKNRNSGSNDTERIQLEIEEKMYIELLLNIYNQYYTDVYSWYDIINEKENQERILREHLKNVQPNFIRNLSCIVVKYDTYALKKPDITNIHEAMDTLKEALKTTLPPMEESVEKVISSEYLELLLNQLKCNNIGGFVMTIGQIRRALTEGTYHKYIKGNSNVFFNLKCDYNLNEIKNYVNALQDLLALYEDTKKEIAEMK